MHHFRIHTLLCLALLGPVNALAANMDSRDKSLRDWQAGAGAKPCAKVPRCTSAELLSYGSSGWQCVPLPNCARNQVLTRRNHRFQCTTP